MSQESRCLEVFKRGDKQNAERLLPQIRPAKVSTRDLYTVMVNGIEIDIASESSLLHLAAAHGWMDVILDLIITKYKCNPKYKNSQGCTSLHYASTAGQLELVRYFINEQHCDPMTTDNKGQTPLHYSCHYGNLNIARYLINHPNRISKYLLLLKINN